MWMVRVLLVPLRCEERIPRVPMNARLAARRVVVAAAITTSKRRRASSPWYLAGNAIATGRSAGYG